MMRRTSTIVVTIAVVAFAALQPARSAGDPQIERGRVLFTRVGCYECHGNAGQGGAAGPHIAGWPAVAIAAYARHPAREMPPYTQAVISDADLGAIAAYVHALPTPAPAPAK